MANGLRPPRTDVKVRLTGCKDSFQILARVEKSLKQHGYEELSREYVMEATSGDFAHLMVTTLEYVDVEMDDRPRPGSASQANPGPAGRDEI